MASCIGLLFDITIIPQKYRIINIFRFKAGGIYYCQTEQNIYFYLEIYSLVSLIEIEMVLSWWFVMVVVV